MLFLLLSTLIIVGCTTGNEENYGSFISIANDEVVTMYVDGVDVTNERKELEDNLKTNVSQYYDKDKEDIGFQMFCMLDAETITVEVEVEDSRYLGTGNEKGEITSAVAI